MVEGLIEESISYNIVNIMNPYHHLQYLDRRYIADHIKAGKSIRSIARLLGRAPSTISRELKRNTLAGQAYEPQDAEDQALRRRSESRCKIRGLFAELIIEDLERDLSPDQIVM